MCADGNAEAGQLIFNHGAVCSTEVAAEKFGVLVVCCALGCFCLGKADLGAHAAPRTMP